MGQYYKIAFKHDGPPVVNNRQVESADYAYVMMKLMEHSYLGNYLCKAVAKEISGHPTRIAWVGDYADEVKVATHGDLSYGDVWGDEESPHVFRQAKRFSYKKKWLVNHDKKVCISFDKWIEGYKDKEWPIFPVSILTAIGNGRGGGDYFGNAMARVGSWTWDLIEITKKKPEGYEVLDFTFHYGKESDAD